VFRLKRPVDQRLQFVISALFAGQINSGINAAWVLCYLADNPQWMARAREEVAAVARKYNPHSESSLVDQLSNIPVEAWEMEFTFLDCCLKDSIRLQSLGTAFRKNIGGENIRIGDEIIPPGTFIVSFGLLYSSNGISSIQSAPTNSSFYFLDISSRDDPSESCYLSQPRAVGSFTLLPRARRGQESAIWVCGLGRRKASVPRHEVCQTRDEHHHCALSGHV
jgi:hypothetical protein